MPDKSFTTSAACRVPMRPGTKTHKLKLRRIENEFEFSYVGGAEIHTQHTQTHTHTCT